MINYLVIGVAVIALALLAIWATGGVAFFLIVPLTRLLPVAAAILATVAVSMIAQRFGAGMLPVVVFAIPVLLLAFLPIAPYVLALRGVRYFDWVGIGAPVLPIFPALALWHLAKNAGRRI
ncbi:MAG TPA: hypothetical protein VF601_14275 [Beijerinckiaceae bacterium]|jgi:hypothetical protein